MAKTALCVLLASAVVVLPGVGHAQEAVETQGAVENAGTTSGVPDPTDVIVTARRRAERLEDVPLAITAISGAELQERNIVSVQELQQLTPSVNFTPVNGRGTSVGLSIRGQRQLDQAITFDPSVGVYLNEVYQARPAGFDTSLFDLESVQVLKGPQGTYFGRNTTAGAVLFETRKPGSTFGGYLQANIEDPRGFQVEGALDLPFSDKVAIRVAGRHVGVNGYTRNIGSGQRLDDRDRTGGRITLDLRPTESVRSTTVVDYFRSSENGTAFFARGYNPVFVNAFLAQFPAPVGAYLGSVFDQYNQERIAQAGRGRVVDYDTDQRSTAKSFGASNTTSVELSDDLTLKNVVGYRWVKQYDRLDLDGTQANLIASDQFQSSKGWSEELQLGGKSLSDRLDWILGAYYFREKGEETGDSWTFSPILPTPGRRINFTGRNISKSLFAHGTYTLPFEHRTRIAAGLRYTWDDRRATPRTVAFSPAGATCLVEGSPAGSCGVEREAKFSAASWTVSLDHEFVKDNMVYASISRGYRAGGIDGRAQSLQQQQPFAPEKVTAYEIGLKSAFDVGGMRFFFNGDVFYQKYNDIQKLLAVLLPGNSAPSTVALNAATATIKGAEFDASVRLTPRLRLGVLYGFLDSSYDKFDSNFLGDLSGNDFAYAPRHTVSANVGWDVADTKLGGFRLDGSVYHTSSYNLQDTNTAYGLISSYTIANASVTLERLAGTKMTLQLYAKNLFDKNYAVGGLDFSDSLGYAAVQLAPPRVIGLSLRVPFGGER